MWRCTRGTTWRAARSSRTPHNPTLAPEAYMRMRRHVLVALTVLSLAGCASTQTSDTPLKSGGGAIDPTALRPDLSDDVSGGVQTREVDAGNRGGGGTGRGGWN